MTPFSDVCFILQSKLGTLFRPVLPLTHMREVEPPFSSPKQPLPPQPEPEAKPEALPSTTTVTATTTTTSVNREKMWATVFSFAVETWIQIFKSDFQGFNKFLKGSFPWDKCP